MKVRLPNCSSSRSRTRTSFSGSIGEPSLYVKGTYNSYSFTQCDSFRFRLQGVCGQLGEPDACFTQSLDSLSGNEEDSVGERLTWGMAHQDGPCSRIVRSRNLDRHVHLSSPAPELLAHQEI